MSNRFYYTVWVIVLGWPVVLFVVMWLYFAQFKGRKASWRASLSYGWGWGASVVSQPRLTGVAGTGG